MPTVYGYGRVSTPHQRDSGLSIEAQKEAIERYHALKLTNGQENPRNIWGGHFIDAAISGKKPFVNRPQGQELDRRLQPGDHVIVTKRDRAFRNLKDALLLLEIWESREIKLHVLDCPFDTSQPTGKLFFRISVAMAEWERETIAQRIREALAVKRSKGGKLNRFAGYGFKWQGGKRVPDDVQLLGMAIALRLVNQGISPGQAAKLMNAWRVPIRILSKVEEKWIAQRVRRLAKAAEAAGLSEAPDSILAKFESDSGVSA